MKQEDEVYFSAKMVELADKFNAMAQAADKISDRPGALEDDPAMVRMRDSLQAFSDQLGNEFDAAGYTNEDWNDLMVRSGASKKMGMM